MNTDFKVEIHFNSGSQKLGGFSIKYTFNNTLMAINTENGTNGIDAEIYGDSGENIRNHPGVINTAYSFDGGEPGY